MTLNLTPQRSDPRFAQLRRSSGSFKLSTSLKLSGPASWKAGRTAGRNAGRTVKRFVLWL